MATVGDDDGGFPQAKNGCQLPSECMSRIRLATVQIFRPFHKVGRFYDNASMPVLFIVLIVLVILSFGGGLAQPRYRTHGISLGTILLIVLLLWLFGVFGTRPW